METSFYQMNIKGNPVVLTRNLLGRISSRTVFVFLLFLTQELSTKIQCFAIKSEVWDFEVEI